MKKIDITKLSIEYYHKNKKYYRIIYNDTKSKKNMFYSDPDIKEISKQTAMNWVKKGARLYEYRYWDEWNGYEYNCNLDWSAGEYSNDK